MPRRAAQLLSLLVVLLMLLSDLLVGWPPLDGTDAAPGAGSLPTANQMDDPAFASQRARRLRDRKQDRRHDRQQDRKHERNQNDHQRKVKKRRAAARTGATRQDCSGPDIVSLRGLGLCTHGPDAVPAEFDVREDVPALDEVVATQEAAAIGCDGDGQDGFRTEVLYVHPPGVDRYDQYLGSIQAWSAQMDQIYRYSSMQTGPVRSVRLVQDPDSCLPLVRNVQLSSSTASNFGRTISELRSKGFARQDRIYLMFFDANYYCGIGTFGPDESPYVQNVNNIGPSYARVDAGCWSGNVAAHEVMHNLGGVQYQAPNTSGGAHCIDEYDIMCYRDAPRYPQMKIVCPDSTKNRTSLDCNHDDYFNTSPAPGSYLATHWNPANNRFLTNALPLASAPPPPVVEPDGRQRTSRDRHRDRKQRKHKNNRRRR